MIIWEWLTWHQRVRWGEVFLIVIFFGMFFMAYVTFERWFLEVRYMRHPPGIICENVLQNDSELDLKLATMEFD